MAAVAETIVKYRDGEIPNAYLICFRRLILFYFHSQIGIRFESFSVCTRAVELRKYAEARKGKHIDREMQN